MLCFAVVCCTACCPTIPSQVFCPRDGRPDDDFSADLSTLARFNGLPTGDERHYSCMTLVVSQRTYFKLCILPSLFVCLLLPFFFFFFTFTLPLFFFELEMMQQVGRCVCRRFIRAELLVYSSNNVRQLRFNFLYRYSIRRKRRGDRRVFRARDYRL